MNYDAWSIYYDRINTPYNIDIKKIFDTIVTNDLHIPKIFIIRILTRKYPFSTIFDKIIKEAEVKYSYLPLVHGMIYSKNIDRIDVINNIITGLEDVLKKNSIKINKYIFITPNQIDYNNKYKKNILMITGNENLKDYDNIINQNYNDYLIDDVKLLKNKIKEYDKYNGHNIGTGESVINEHMFFQLNMFIEALNKHNLHFGCFNFKVDFSENIDHFEQRILFFNICHKWTETKKILLHRLIDQ